MFKTRILTKIGLYVFLYAICFYFIPLPQLAFLGFLFPLAYLYADMKSMKHIQSQYILGFGVGIILAYIMIQISAMSFYFGFVMMSLIFLISFYFSCFASWMKLPLILFAIIVSMIFNLVIASEINLVPSIFSKFILSILLSVFLYGFIDRVLGDSQHVYLPTAAHKKIGILFNKVSQYRYHWHWLYARHTICVYLGVLTVLAIQTIFALPGALCAISTASLLIVLGNDNMTTQVNISLRALGAIFGIFIAYLQLLILTALPFFFMQIGLIILIMILFAYIILLYQRAAKFLPQAAVTYFTVIITGIGSDAQLSGALVRIIGILIGVVLAYLLSLFFFMLKPVAASKMSL